MSKIYVYLASIAAFIAGLAGIYLKGKSEGKEEIETKVKAEAAKQVIEDVKLKQKVTEDVKEEINTSSIDERIGRL